MDVSHRSLRTHTTTNQSDEGKIIVVESRTLMGDLFTGCDAGRSVVASPQEMKSLFGLVSQRAKRRNGAS